MNRLEWLTLLTVVGSAGAQSGLGEPFADGTWTLLRLVDARGTVALQGPNASTLTLTGTKVSTAEGTQVAGSGGCNRFTGRGVFTATTVRLGPLATTRRACAPEQNELEARYLNVLSRALGLSFSPRTLVLSSVSERLVFGHRVTAFEASRLFTGWQLVGSAGETLLTLRLEPDGRVSGNTGCNLFTGTYTVEGERLHFSPLATTSRGCPGEAAQQETAYLRLLEQVRHYRMSGDTLILILVDGSERTFTHLVEAS